MKRATTCLISIAALALYVGCDEWNAPTDLQSFVATKSMSAAKPIMDQQRDRDQLQLRDGTCHGTGPAWGGNGPRGNGKGQGGGYGDQLRLRDGSCGDG